MFTHTEKPLNPSLLQIRARQSARSTGESTDNGLDTLTQRVVVPRPDWLPAPAIKLEQVTSYLYVDRRGVEITAPSDLSLETPQTEWRRRRLKGLRSITVDPRHTGVIGRPSPNATYTIRLEVELDLADAKGHRQVTVPAMTIKDGERFYYLVTPSEDSVLQFKTNEGRSVSLTRKAFTGNLTYILTVKKMEGTMEVATESRRIPYWTLR